MVAETGETPIAKLLIDAGADVDATRTHGLTALMGAVGPMFNDISVDMVRALVDAGANVNAKSTAWNTFYMGIPSAKARTVLEWAVATVPTGGQKATRKAFHHWVQARQNESKYM